MPLCLESYTARLNKNISKWSNHLKNTLVKALSGYNKEIWPSEIVCFDILVVFRGAICNIKISTFTSYAMAANVFFLMSSTLLMRDIILAVVVLLWINSFSANYIFACESMRKNISKITFILVSINKKILQRSISFLACFEVRNLL